MTILWIALAIVGLFGLACFIGIALAIAAGRPEPCPHGDSRAGCEPCHYAEIEATL